MPDDDPDLIRAIDGCVRAAAGDLPSRLGVAVSGGGDSLALLLAARDWAAPAGIAVHAATVDHGLRPEAADEARRVAGLCAARGIAHATLKVAGLSDGANLQARARDARYRTLGRWARDAGIELLLLGHTLDDVAETLVMRLGRGHGLDGLAAIPAVRQVHGCTFARPFLDVTRARLRAMLLARGIAPVEDPSNDDPRFERAAIRRTMAALGLAPAMVGRAARHLDAAREALDHAVARAVTEVGREDRGDVILDRAALAALPRETRRRVLLVALGWIAGTGPPRDAEQARLLAWAAHPGAPVTLGGCRFAAEADAIRIAREAARCGPAVPVGEVWDGRWTLAGPAAPGLTVDALGADVVATPWRGTGLPRASLLASPAIRDGLGLVAAPLAGLGRGWTARPRVAFARAPMRR